jgi:UrcA family protein
MTTQRNLRVRRAAAALALALGSALAVAGEASDHTTLRQQTVRFGDLNLQSVEGVVTLYRRITSAAEEVCAPSSRPGSRIVSSDYRDCVARAVAEAVAKIGRPELSTLYAWTEHSAWRRWSPGAYSR